MTRKRIVSLLSDALFNRVETYLESPVAGAKNKSDLVEKALLEYLDREEVIAAEMEKVLLRIRKGRSSD